MESLYARTLPPNTPMYTASVPLRPGHSALERPGACLQDLKAHLRGGVTLDELWRVARGELRYADWVKQRGGAGGGGAGGGGAAPAAPPAASVPQELVNVQAYLLWEKARASVAWLPQPCSHAVAAVAGASLQLWARGAHRRPGYINLVIRCGARLEQRTGHFKLRRLWCDVQGGDEGVQPGMHPDAPSRRR